MKNKTMIIVHGGAGPDSELIRTNHQSYLNGLKTAVRNAQQLLHQGRTAIDAVCAAVRSLEDNPFFNAGHGSALNHLGEIEMDAAIMEGDTKKAGGVAMVRQIANPIDLARQVMERTDHVLLAGYGANDFAESIGMAKIAAEDLVTQHQLDELQHEKRKDGDLLRKPVKGTVGAVALDCYGHIAAATSTGGTTNSLPSRIGDSCLIGCGCYANDQTCAVSGTGDGEILIRNVAAHSVSMLMETGNYTLQQACEEVVYHRNSLAGDIGIIAITSYGDIGIAFNSERMHRAWAIDMDEPQAAIYS